MWRGRAERRCSCQAVDGRALLYVERNQVPGLAISMSPTRTVKARVPCRSTLQAFSFVSAFSAANKP